MFKFLKEHKLFKGKRKWIVLWTPFLLWFAFCLPNALFKDSYSTVIESKDGRLLSATIAADEQWRFPKSDSVPYKFQQAIIQYEDASFRYHLGVNPISLVKAMSANYKAGRVVRGGSTLTMQLMRMARGNKSRSVRQKLIEMIWATRIELSHSKDEILELYAAHAPFGGNVVGLEAASWRYFNRAAKDLSWAESCVLAVLPNAPAMIHLGKNRKTLRDKRDFLLNKLYLEGIINAETYELAIQEEIPPKPFDLPTMAPHFLKHLEAKGLKGKRVVTSIDFNLQREVRASVARYNSIYKQNKVNNAAIIVVDNETRQIVSYIGNTVDAQHQFQNYVDCAKAPRSSGSILKPILYAASISDGEIMPKQFLRDLPVQFGSYVPENFDKSFKGLVPADQALISSLNIPAVNLLKQYGVETFHKRLNQIGFTTIRRSPDNYGLSLILGGAEVSLLDLATVYSGLANTLVNDSIDSYQVTKLSYSPDELNLWKIDSRKLSPGAMFLTFDALKNVNRPNQEWGWESFGVNENISWKTGTSHGFRDAWSVGVTPKYTVAVWVGNATGEGRPELTGVNYAAPLMFSVFHLLRGNQQFEKPISHLSRGEVCSVSGMKASDRCLRKEDEWMVAQSERLPVCSYHKRFYVDANEEYRVSRSCDPHGKFASYLVLSPSEAYYYKQFNGTYREPPTLKQGCGTEKEKMLEFINPTNNSVLELAKDLNGKKGVVVFHAAHTNSNSILHWYNGDTYLGKTSGVHKMEIDLEKGKRYITISDDKGCSETIRVTIL